jgi:prepilin-type processing-associated H-X9-DG protein
VWIFSLRPCDSEIKIESIMRPVWRIAGSALPKRGLERAFTLLEALVAVGIIAVLASILLPLLAHGRRRAQGVQCLNNLRQLQYAWHMYADDSDGKLLPNRHGKDVMGPTPNQTNWVGGWMDWTSSSHNTNRAFLTDPEWARIAPHLAYSAKVFKCPADHFQSPDNPGPRVRSLSMDACMGEGNNKTAAPGSTNLLICASLADVAMPANAWVFIDENPDSLNDGCFFVDVQQDRWLDLPASFHNGAGGITYADGHAELKKWVEPSTKRPVSMIEGNFWAFVPAGPKDIKWLQARTPQR